MKNYLHYHLEDFVWDELFRQWVLSPNQENVVFWQKWLTTHPEKAELIQQARSMVQSLQLQELELNDQEIKEAIQQTIDRVKKDQSFKLRQPG